MPIVKTKGAASSQGFGEFAQASTVANYIEDVFSTYLYTGNGSTQTITNGIDLAGKGGLVWIKNRNAGLGYSTDHALFDTARGATKYLISNATASQTTVANSLTSFNSTGFSLGADGSDLVNDNTGGNIYASWTFREQPKFFDVVTWTGTGSATTIAHNLGSAPGCIFVKRTDSGTNSWVVYHTSLGNTQVLQLNTTDATVTGSIYWNNTSPTSTVFSIGTSTSVNASGGTYVAYLFAHNAGGFGLTGTDNVISCGSYTGNGSANGPTVTLGYEPQWLLVKNASSAIDWYIIDNMRGWSEGNALFPNLSDAESAALAGSVQLNSTGFKLTQTYAAINASGSTYIYIAIRRGPMKVPTSGTTVYQATTYSGNNTNNRSISTNFPVDMFLDLRRNGVQDKYALDRLRGNERLWTNLTNAGSANTAQVPANSFNANQTGVLVSADELNTSTRTYVLEAFKRAPSFFDEVCDTGTGVAKTVSHNLTVAPELIIRKSRSDGTREWVVYSSALGATQRIFLNLTNAADASSGTWNDTAPTSSVFTVGSNNNVNGSGQTFVTYLFATCAGVSKVGSYTGTGALQTVNCGFTSAARFVLIKRTDSTGDWYVYDSARGIQAGNDPYLLLNSDAAEVTGTDYVEDTSVGFKVNAAASSTINVSGGTYIFLAIA